MSMLTPAWYATLRARAADPAFAPARAALAAQVARYREVLPPLPERQAGYYHEFFCPEHAVQLRFDPHKPHEHVCPVDGKVYSGEPFDSAWRWSVNDWLSDAALKFALHARLAGDTADEQDRTRARDILTGYAARYRTIPIAPSPHPNHPGVVTWSGLDESVWIIRLAWAYALLGDALKAEDAAQIREELLRPAAEHLHRVRWPKIHNVTTWNNAALVTLAVVLDDEALLEATLTGPIGVRAQLAQGVRDDGFWWEGSPSYHYYTLAAVVWTVRALRTSGRPFADDDVVRQMFSAPLAIAFPDLTLPAIHDCWYHIGLLGEVGHGIPDAAGFYEVGYGWYGDPAFAWVLRQNYARRPRVALEALLDGATTVPDVPEPAFTSQHAVGSGLAVLRSNAPRDRQTYLLLNAGPDAGGHGHPDQLSMQLFAAGARFVADLGTPGYGIALNDTWYRQTGSHATLLLDGQSQPPTEARITRYEVGSEPAQVVGEVTWTDGPYAGVTMRRTIFWRDDYFIDVCHVTCPTPRQVDWVLPVLGLLVEAPARESVPAGLAGDCGYAHFDAVGQLSAVGDMRLRWQSGGAALDLYLPLNTEERFVATAPANPASEHLAALVRRQTASTATFLAVFAPSAADEAPVVRAVHWPGDAAAGELVVEAARGEERWRVDLLETGELRLVLA
ncbi:MAG: heparinase II/III domain-containing protein [Thermomicrobiales bacterium]